MHATISRKGRKIKKNLLDWLIGVIIGVDAVGGAELFGDFKLVRVDVNRKNPVHVCVCVCVHVCVCVCVCVCLCACL